MRLRKLKDASEILNNNPLVIKNPQDYKGKWNEYFQNQNPIYLEIGMGKGKFIIENAIKNPNINFIGFEKESTVICKALRKVEKLANLVFVCDDAENLDNIFSIHEVSKIFLNFSDPWPKNRHEKRRLTYESKLLIYQKILDEKGSIEFKTDNRHLFEYSLQSFTNHGFHILDISLNLHEDKENIITTEYEDKFVSLGKIIYYVEVSYGKNETL